MASLKFIAFFNQARVNTNTEPNTNVGIATWTEITYAEKAFDDASMTQFIELMQQRMRLASKDTWVSKIRMQEVLPTGKTRSLNVDLRGGSSLICSDPEQALSWNLGSSTTANSRVLTLRGIPDARCEGGVYVHNQFYDGFLLIYFASLKVGGWRFRGKDMSGAKAKIDTIAADGIVKTQEDFIPPAGARVQVLRTTAAGRRQKGIVSLFTDQVGTRQIKLTNWPYGASKGGTIRLVLPDILCTPTISVPEMTTPVSANRQTGANPSRKSRGRRSARNV